MWIREEALTWDTSVVDLHVSGIRPAVHQERVADVNRACPLTTALVCEVGKLDAVGGVIATGVIARGRSPVEGPINPDQRARGAGQTQGRNALHVEALAAHLT